MHCCGVSGAADWDGTADGNGTNFDWEDPDYDKPEGCCLYKKDEIKLNADEIKANNSSGKYNYNTFLRPVEVKALNLMTRLTILTDVTISSERKSKTTRMW